MMNFEFAGFFFWRDGKPGRRSEVGSGVDECVLEVATKQTRETGDFTISSLDKLVKAEYKEQVGCNSATGRDEDRCQDNSKVPLRTELLTLGSIVRTTATYHRRLEFPRLHYHRLTRMYRCSSAFIR